MKIPVLSLLSALLIIAGCKKRDAGPAAPEVVAYSFDNDGNSSLMFQDGEDLSVMTAEARRFEIGKALRVKAVNETSIEVANFTPADIEDATILMQAEGQPKAIKLFRIKKIRAHAIDTIPYPFVSGTTRFLDADNAATDLSAYASGIAVNKVSFDFTGETELIKKLKSLSRLKWKIKYHDFDAANNTGDNWKETPDAKDFRRFSGFIINLAYLIQEDATRTAFVAEPITDNNQVLMTAEQKEVAFKKIIDMPTFNCGIVVNVSGLGGGATFGVANHILKDYLTADVCFIVVHEIGHMIGYSHSSTMTYPADNKGAVVATGKVYKQLLTAGAFPIKVANYYKPADL